MKRNRRCLSLDEIERIWWLVIWSTGPVTQTISTIVHLIR